MMKCNQTAANDGARAILKAGCSGVPQLTWNLRLYLDGLQPKYAEGDAPFEDAELYEALTMALEKLATD